MSGSPSALATAARLEAWALEAGFDRAGVATLGPSPHGEHLRQWLAAGDHAGMAWMARRVEAREDPAKVLPGARSVLCVALQYHPLAPSDGSDGSDGSDNDLWPRVARYARGRDYHDVMGARLRTLEARIRDAFGCATRRYVDTGPVLERALAARAGLGSFGKNACLLDRRWGSYFLLGELLLTLELGDRDAHVDPGDSAADLCGRCTRCLDACPTGALYAPYRLDSRRCISYWTIEHRGDLPAAAREMVGEWVFGCDVCQEVCPYNRSPPAVDHPELALPVARAELDLAGLLAISRQDYVERFRHSPMKRAKQVGLRRNAAVAMGNRGARRYLPALLAALAADEPTVRRHAAWALARIGGRRAADGLRDALAGERNPAVREEIERARATVAGGTNRLTPE